MRRHGPFDRRSLLGSIAVHVVVLSLVLWSTVQARPPLEFVTYQIDLVSPPPAVQAAEPEEAEEKLVIERPEPEPTPPEPEKPEPVVEEKPKPPEPPKPREQPSTTPAKEADERKAAAVETPVEEAKESGEGINVRLEGVRRDYPAYYENIIRQIQRCFRWTGQGSWETTVYFVIRRDGTVGELDFVKKSGNPQFDFEALGAVDCAGKGRFGPLPDELPWDQLPIQFKFRPSGGSGGAPPALGDIQNAETKTIR
jgi:outer membrane biosynthesis protein TonB